MSKQSSSKKRVRREQPRKDSRDRRVNYDNTRLDKFEKDSREVQGTRPRDTKQTKASNDVRWYANNPELLRSAASIPFSTTTGLPIPFGSFDQHTNQNAVPGVCAIKWRPSIGGAFNDAINQAANSTYSFVVHANSRNKSYDAPDLMLMILAGANLFSMLGHGIRAYGVMRTFDQRNAYLPEALITAMGFNYDDLKSNLSDMWFGLNELIARISQIWIPNTFPLIERWFWMNSNVYIDSSSVKGQFYIFRPSYYLVYHEEGDYFADDHVASLNYTAWYSSTSKSEQLTWAEYLKAMNAMFKPLLNSQDRGMIFGDILKAYGADKLYGMPAITSDYQIVPIYDREVLTQIENATAFKQAPESITQDPTTNDIYEKYYTPATQSVTYPDWSSGVIVPPATQILNFHQMEVPTPEQVMVATRLKCAGVAPTANGKGLTGYIGTQAGGVLPATSGTEVCTEFIYYTHNYDVENGRTLSPYRTLNVYNAALDGWTPWFIWTSFDWAPWIYVIPNVAQPWSSVNTPVNKEVVEALNAKLYPEYGIGDYDMYTTINIEELKKMHQTAVYSEFGVPTI